MLEHSPSGFLSILAITISIRRLNEGCQLRRKPCLFFVDRKGKKVARRFNGSYAALVRADINPFWLHKAYQIAKNAAKMEALGAVDVSELEAKIRAELEAKYAAQPQAQAVLPTSLAGVQSARGSAAQPSTFSFDDIFRR